MITKVHLENFKRFREVTLDTADLTVFTGANGAGKTSVLHALLLARQMARAPHRHHVELNGVDTLELGSAADVIHREAGNGTAVVELTEGAVARWSFRAPDDRTLNAQVVAGPDGYHGVLAQQPPHFSYLCAERLGPRDVLAASSVAVGELDVGSRGEFTAQVLDAFSRERVSAGRLADPGETSPVAGLLHQTERWMGVIVRPIQIEATWFPETSVTRLRFKSPGLFTEWTRSPNAGFGISYALPIIVAALRASSGGTLLIENPEAHLHPAGQSAVGSFLARVAADGVQVILETHSDHVLNGIRVAVASGRANLRPEQAAIHFFGADPEGRPAVQSMELKETGQLSSWPPGFFDQGQIDLAALARSQRRKS